MSSDQRLTAEQIAELRRLAKHHLHTDAQEWLRRLLAAAEDYALMEKMKDEALVTKSEVSKEKVKLARELEAAAEREGRLREALTNLGDEHPGSGELCWCSAPYAALENGHAAYCQKARAALEGGPK